MNNRADLVIPKNFLELLLIRNVAANLRCGGSFFRDGRLDRIHGDHALIAALQQAHEGAA